MRALLLAFRFLTILPLPGRSGSERVFGQSTMFFPLVGLFIGAVLAAAHWLPANNGLSLPVSIQAFLLLTLLLLLTRGLHVEGLGDFLDGFLGGHDRDATLRIMKDSRAGGFAVLGIFWLLLGKFIMLGQLLQSGHLAFIVAAPVLSRWAAVALLFRARDARREGGIATVFLTSLTGGYFIVATLMAAGISFLLVRHLTIALMILAGLIMLLVRGIANKKIAGITGDVAGACIEFAELSLLAAACFI